MLEQVQRELVKFEYTRDALMGKETGANPRLDVIYKPTDNKVLGVLPNSQFIISHDEAIERTEAAIKELGIEPEIGDFKLLNNGSKLFVHYRLFTDAEKVWTDEEGKDDVLIPEFILRNGYDGKTTFGIDYGFYREICSNGARALVFGQRASRKAQMGDVDVDVIMTGVKQFLAKVPELVWKKVISMTTLNVGINFPIELRSQLIGHLSNKLLEEYDVSVNQAQEKNGGNITQWALFNILTYLVTHRVGSYNRRRDLNQVVARKFGFNFNFDE